jgi:RecA-family ATPase
MFTAATNIRGQVQQFIAVLRRLAIRYRVAIVLIAHPSLSGMASGSGNSGNTAWNNSVRSRLYLQPMLTAEDEEPDPLPRQLTVKKNNRGPNGTTISLRRDRGRFCPLNGATSFERMATDQAVNHAFLKLLDITAAQGRDVSPNKSSAYAPAVFSKMPDAGGVKSKQFAAAMERLPRDRKITVERYGRPSNLRSRIIKA